MPANSSIMNAVHLVGGNVQPSGNGPPPANDGAAQHGPGGPSGDQGTGDGAGRSGAANPMSSQPSIAPKIEAPSEVLAIIAKMFYDPIPNPCPVGLNMMPTMTESLKIKLEDDFIQYSPVLWADPLIIYALTAGTEKFLNDNVNAVGVDVNLSGDGIGAAMEYSGFGLQIKALVDADISQTGAIRSIMPVPGSKDQQSIATIMHLTDHTSSGLLDEAAIVRLFMLQSLSVDPWLQVFSSSLIYELAVNVYPDRTTAVRTWTKAFDASDGLQIGTSKSTSVLYFRTINEYAALIAGYSTEALKFKERGNTISTENVVYIPVKSCWRGQSWLMPYILSFTTTAWWNHASTITVGCKNTEDDLKTGLKFEAVLMNRASTVYIPGSYSKICLVIVDSTTSTFPSSQAYTVVGAIAATRAGNEEFAKQAMAYLGRADMEGVPAMVPEDVTQAMNHMCELMATRQEYRRLHVRSAVLATSKYNGWGVYPDPENPPKTAGDGETDRAHIEGLYMFNSKTLLKVGDKQLGDIASANKNTAQHILYNRNNWRTDPLCYFAYGNVNVAKDAAHAPAMWKYNSGCIQYQLTESHHTVRILRACGVYVRDPESDKHIFQRPADVFNTTLAYGSLLLGLTNWAAVELGLTVFEHNRMGKRQKCIDPNYLRLWPELTQNFVVRSSINKNRVVDSALMPGYMGMSMNLAVMVKNIKDTWYDVHYSWNVPWWYVSAIAEKFGHKFVVKTHPNSEYIGDADNMMGYIVEFRGSKQTDLSILTSSTQYEKRVRRNKPAFFEILTPTVNGKDEGTNFLSYALNAFTDAAKHKMRNRGAAVLDSLDGVCELNVVVFPSMRTMAMKTCPRSFVTEANRVDPRDESTYPYISGGLKYPNPWIDWVIKDGMAVLPPLLAGNWIGAITGGLAVVIDALSQWNEKSDETHGTFEGETPRVEQKVRHTDIDKEDDEEHQRLHEPDRRQDEGILRTHPSHQVHSESPGHNPDQTWTPPSEVGDVEVQHGCTGCVSDRGQPLRGG